MKSHLFIQGPPRSGKTTLVQSLIKEIKGPVTGFYTTEVRDVEGKRMGFDIIDIESGKIIPLSRKNWEFPEKISSYSVDVNSFSEYLQNTEFSGEIIVVDEIGKMELLSPIFLNWLKGKSEKFHIIATIPTTPASKVTNLMHNIDYTRIRISRNTRGRALKQAKNWIKTKFG